jgi:ribonuclease HII
MKKDVTVKYLLGIDEVGRGPIAGPVAVGVVGIEKNNLKKILKKFPKLNDSKKISEKVREEIFKVVKDTQEIFYSVKYCSAKDIDKIGISNCIKKCIEGGLRELEKKGIQSGNCEVRLDGALRAPSTYPHQTTIIHGDSSEPIISLASVIAKVSRDAHMKKLHKKFPEYNFAKNKGYGTKSHVQSIKNSGLSAEHRKTFCTRI